MRQSLSVCAAIVGTALTMVLAQGCKQQDATPVQAPRAAPVRRPEPEMTPVQDMDLPAAQPVARHRRVSVPQVMPVPVIPVPSDAEIEAQQRQRDAKLLEQQQAASQNQQRELNQQVQQSQKIRDQMQAEPRIQNAPGPAETGAPPGFLGTPPPGQEPVRIQDAPGPTTPVPAVQPTQPVQPAQPQTEPPQI